MTENRPEEAAKEVPNGHAPRPLAFGSGKNKTWYYSHEKQEYDLTHGAPLERALRFTADTGRKVLIDPERTALVIIDMQNFFLHPAVRPQSVAGRKAHDVLCDAAIPACRRAGIDVVFLNWGLTDADISSMPASLRHNFSRSLVLEAPSTAPSGKPKPGMGEDMGTITFPDEKTGKKESVQGGKELMRDQWNAQLWGRLDAVWQDARSGKAYSDSTFWVHKNRASGLSIGSGTSDMLQHLQTQRKSNKPPLKTLLFAGVNTDQCVYGTYIDAVTLGYDCVLLEDCCGTTSPEYCTQMSLFNCARNGFVASASASEKGTGFLTPASSSS